MSKTEGTVYVLALAALVAALIGLRSNYKTQKELEHPKPVEPAPYSQRIMTDGTNYFVQEYWFGGWHDDVFGGYFSTLEAASNRAEWNKQTRNGIQREEERKRKYFKPIQ